MFNKELVLAAVKNMPKEEFMAKFRAALDKSHINYEIGKGSIVWAGLPAPELDAVPYVNFTVQPQKAPVRNYSRFLCDSLDTKNDWITGYSETDTRNAAA